MVSDYGIGLRMNLPICPLAVDYAIPIQKNNSIDRG
ncbi:BamA/TamA family outer membrane protein [Akkermansia muciniphila]